MVKIDNMGRIVIPKNFRKTYDINYGDELDLIDNGNGLLIRPIMEQRILTEEGLKLLNELYDLLEDEDYKKRLEKIIK